MRTRAAFFPASIHLAVRHLEVRAPLARQEPKKKINQTRGYFFRMHICYILSRPLSVEDPFHPSSRVKAGRSLKPLTPLLEEIVLRDPAGFTPNRAGSRLAAPLNFSIVHTDR
jgi:hypothetical protein